MTIDEDLTEPEVEIAAFFAEEFAQTLGFTLEELQKAGKHRSYVAARQKVAVALCRKGFTQGTVGKVIKRSRCIVNKLVIQGEANARNGRTATTSRRRGKIKGGIAGGSACGSSNKQGAYGSRDKD